MIDIQLAKVKSYVEGKSNIGQEFYISEKLDGVRITLIRKNGCVQAIGKNDDKYGNKVDYTFHLAHIIIPEKYGDCILDGECVASKILPGYNGTCGTTVAILNSNNHEHDQLLEFYPFDILVYNNLDVRQSKLTARFAMLGLYPKIHTNINNINKALEECIKTKKEGIIIKRADKPYGECWYKLKVQPTIDAYIVAINEGKGKYYNSCGSITLAVCDDEGNDYIICNCPPGDDTIRKDIYNLSEFYINKVVEIGCQNITPNRKVTQPRIIRWRDDKQPIDCNLEQLEV